MFNDDFLYGRTENFKRTIITKLLKFKVHWKKVKRSTICKSVSKIMEFEWTYCKERLNSITWDKGHFYGILLNFSINSIKIPLKTSIKMSPTYDKEVPLHAPIM